MDKFELIDKIILTINQAADASGIQRCALLVSAVQLLGALKGNLTESDKAAAAREALLVAQLNAPRTDETIGGQTVKIDFGGDDLADNSDGE